MPMHITPSIDIDLDRIEPMLPQMGPITVPLSPATQNDILGILQREQDRAMALISSSPLLAGLFVSYANQAAALESLSVTSSFKSEERKALQNTIATLQEEMEKLKLENVGVVEGLKAAEASQEAFRSQISSLKEVNTTQQADIKSLRAKLTEAKNKYNQLAMDSNAENVALQRQVSDLEAERGELKEAVVGQQIKILKLERQGEKSRPPGFPPAIAAHVDKSDFTVRMEHISGDSEKVESCMPLTEKGKKRAGGRSHLSGATMTNDSADDGKLDTPKHLNINDMATRVSTSPVDRRLKDTERGPPPAEPPPLGLVTQTVPEVSLNTTSGLPKTPKGVQGEVPMTPEPRPTLSLTTPQAHVYTPTPAQPEKPMTLWERKKLRAATLSASASTSLGDGDTLNSSVVSGETGGGGHTESIAIPTLVGDRSPTFTDTAHDQREEQRKNDAEELLGPNPARRREGPDRPQMAVRPITKPAPSPTLPHKANGWGSWSSSLLNNIATVVAVETSPSPERPLMVSHTLSQPPKSQPTGRDSLNKPASSVSMAGDNDAWESKKAGPAQITREMAGPRTWGAKPIGPSSFGSGGSVWGNVTGPTFGADTGKNPAVDDATTPQESSPNATGAESVPELDLKTKHVPTPGGSNGSSTDKKTGDTQDDALGQEETVTPVEGDELDRPVTMTTTTWAPVVSFANDLSALNTPDLENEYGCGGGGGGAKKKKKKAKK